MSNKEIEERVRAYEDVDISVDFTGLNENQQNLIKELIKASKIADYLFWKQSSHDALIIREGFKNKPGAFQKYIEINYGPFDRIYDHNRFVGKGERIKPKGAGFYPEDLTKEEFERYVEQNSDQKEELESLYTIVIREHSKLKAIPYHKFYIEEINQITSHLEKASQFTENTSLKKYLSLRAEALRTDDYYASDLAWMELKDNLIDIVIGPIENYEDRLFNYKAAFEAAVMLKDASASEELDTYKAQLDNLEQNLPIENIYKRESTGTGNVLEVVNILYFGGDFQAGIKTIAASLPNDERVKSQKGAKKQLYKNIIEAKYEKILTQIADKLIDPEQLKYLSKESFVSQILLHEISHSLGPDYIYNSKNSVRSGLKEKYSIIEECKADVLGIYHIEYLKNVLNLNEEKIAQSYITYIAGLFRSIRFGYEEAHGAANLIQLNFLEKDGVLKRNNTNGKYRVDINSFHEVMTKLATKLLMIEALGDYNKADKLIENFGKIRSHTLEDLHKLKEIPRDLDLHFEFNKDR